MTLIRNEWWFREDGWLDAMECPGVPLLTLLTSHDEKAAVALRGRGRTDKRGGDGIING